MIFSRQIGYDQTCILLIRLHISWVRPDSRPPLVLCVVVSQNRVKKGLLVVRRLPVRQARVRFSARHPMAVLLMLRKEAMRIQEDGPRRTVKNEWMYDCTVWIIVKKIINFKNCGINATKPLKLSITADIENLCLFYTTRGLFICQKFLRWICIVQYRVQRFLPFWEN